MRALNLGDDASAISRKKGLDAQYFYEGELVCVARGERRTVGIIKSISGDVAREGERMIELARTIRLRMSPENPQNGPRRSNRARRRSLCVGPTVR